MLEDHQGPQRRAVRHPGGQAGLAERAHAVDQHAGRLVPERPQHRLDGPPPADERRPRRHRHALLFLVEERPLGRRHGAPPRRLAGGTERPPAAGTEIDPRQMPVPAALLVRRPCLQEGPPPFGRSPRHRKAAAKLVIEHRGEGRGVRVVDRAVPAHDIGYDGRQLPREGRRSLAEFGGAAGRQHHQRRRRRPERLRDVADAGDMQVPFRRFEQQHRVVTADNIAVAGQMQRLERPLVRRQAVAERRQGTGLLDH